MGESPRISRAAAGERIIIQRRQCPIAALIGTTKLERLERASNAARRLALALGQNPNILEKIEQRGLHPVMAAFGLWQEEPDLATLAEQIAEQRRGVALRPTIDL